MVGAGVLFVLLSLLFFHFLARDLKATERRQMEVWAQAMRSFNLADEHTDLNLVLTVMNENHTIPVVVLTPRGNVQTYRNLSDNNSTDAATVQHAKSFARRMLHEGKYIKIAFSERPGDFVWVCYGESLLLRRLSWFPYVELCVGLILVLISVFALRAFRRAEQNSLWVGLSRETAHQLGTPISSLLAWTDLLGEKYPDDPLFAEVKRDVNRLQLVSDRFSKIGSEPELVPCSLHEVLSRVVTYMQRRLSRRITLKTAFPETDIEVLLNAPLFEWVVENLCKNSADAIGNAEGGIEVAYDFTETAFGVEVRDTGRGIRKSHFRRIFSPGFTTKKRGWGLGLSLAKRIVEEYHHGRLWVKSSTPGKLTVFRIEISR